MRSSIGTAVVKCMQTQILSSQAKSMSDQSTIEYIKIEALVGSRRVHDFIYKVKIHMLFIEGQLESMMIITENRYGNRSYKHASSCKPYELDKLLDEAENIFKRMRCYSYEVRRKSRYGDSS